MMIKRKRKIEYETRRNTNYALTRWTLRENYLINFVSGNSIKLYENFHYFCTII